MSAQLIVIAAVAGTLLVGFLMWRSHKRRSILRQLEASRTQLAQKLGETKRRAEQLEHDDQSAQEAAETARQEAELIETELRDVDRRLHTLSGKYPVKRRTP